MSLRVYQPPAPDDSASLDAAIARAQQVLERIKVGTTTLVTRGARAERLLRELLLWYDLTIMGQNTMNESPKFLREIRALLTLEQPPVEYVLPDGTRTTDRVVAEEAAKAFRER